MGRAMQQAHAARTLEPGDRLGDAGRGLPHAARGLCERAGLDDTDESH